MENVQDIYEAPQSVEEKVIEFPIIKEVLVDTSPSIGQLSGEPSTPLSHEEEQSSSKEQIFEAQALSALIINKSKEHIVSF